MPDDSRFAYCTDAIIPGKGSMTDLEYCRFRQTEAGDYLRAGGTDKRGAMSGAEDWLMEEALIRAEQEANRLNARA